MVRMGFLSYLLVRHLKDVREMVVALRNCLPEDPGRQRPFDDERRIVHLANIFEDAGGKAVAYAGGYYEEGNMTDTPFRRFERAPGGLDDALRDALAVRLSAVSARETELAD
jgi:hypothetical protein